MYRYLFGNHYGTLDSRPSKISYNYLKFSSRGRTFGLSSNDDQDGDDDEKSIVDVLEYSGKILIFAFFYFFVAITSGTISQVKQSPWTT